MATFCPKCGTELQKDYKFCINCGTKIIKEDIFCTNCGTKIQKDYKFCINCGTEINKTNIKQNKSTLQTVRDIIEKEKAENEEKKKKMKTINKIFESEEIQSEIRKNKINLVDEYHIKDILKNKIINEKENMTEGEIKSFIKTEFEKIRRAQEKENARIKKEMSSKKIEKPVMTNGGYCSLSCRHCYEEFFDSGGGIVGDFDSEGYYEYYCRLGHSVALGSFCKDYE